MVYLLQFLFWAAPALRVGGASVGCEIDGTMLVEDVDDVQKSAEKCGKVLLGDEEQGMIEASGLGVPGRRHGLGEITEAFRF